MQAQLLEREAIVGCGGERDEVAEFADPLGWTCWTRKLLDPWAGRNERE